MKKQIKRLLQKEYLTGDDVGRIMILDLVLMYQEMTEGGEGTGFLTNAEKTEIVDRLALPSDIHRFNEYRGLHDYLTSAPAVIESFTKTYEVYRLKLLYLLTDMKYAENEAERSKRRPVIMTERQYAQFKLSGADAPIGGIAVFREPPAAEFNIDENGFYIEREAGSKMDITAEKVLLEYSDFIKAALEGIKNMLAECLAREKALELVARYTKIPQIKKLITPIDTESVILLNETILRAVNAVKRDDGAAEAEIKERLNDILRPIDLDALKPTPAAIKKVRRSMSFSAIKNNSEALIATLKREWRYDCR